MQLKKTQILTLHLIQVIYHRRREINANEYSSFDTPSIAEITEYHHKKAMKSSSDVTTY
jgi:hypothetical protein